MALITAFGGRDLSGLSIPKKETAAANLFVNIGAQLEAKRAANKIEALSNPGAFIGRRNDAIAALFQKKPPHDKDGVVTISDNVDEKARGRVSQYYWDLYERLKEDGVPEVTANKLATEQARVLFENEIALMDLVQFPSLMSTTTDVASTLDKSHAKVAELALK